MISLLKLLEEKDPQDTVGVSKVIDLTTYKKEKGIDTKDPPTSIKKPSKKKFTYKKFPGDLHSW